MFKKVTVFTLALLMIVTQLWALEGFELKGTIEIPEADLNNGGVGNMISSYDIDEDGNQEIYLVNDNWSDGATEVIPRIYKLEVNGYEWEVVWSATLDPFYQNTWPCLSIADLDKDGKKEIVWGPVNSTSVSPNPDRIVVFEHAGGDVFGVDDGNGGYAPNSTWTITQDDGVNLRPMDWEIKDIDGDGVDEIYFADRAGAYGGYYFGVISVDDIPDNADGSETWSMEISGQDFAIDLHENIQNKWDVATIGNNIYAFCEVEIAKINYDGSAWNYTSLSPMAGGSANQSAVGVDLDKDGTEEIVAGIYDWGDDEQKAIVLLQEQGDTLVHTPLVNVNEYFVEGSRGLWGVDYGDIDGDGYLDFIFGSRGGVVNGQIFRLSYKGGDITDPANYEFTKIDEAFVEDADAGIWSVINVTNIDDDPELEVLYTSSASYGGGLGVPAESAPIVVLDYTEGWQGGGGGEKTLVLAEEVQLNGATPEGLNFKQGRMLDGGNTIWFAGMDNATKETWVFRSVDGGQSFTHNATAIPGRIAQMDAYDADVALVACANGKIFKTVDGGATFTECYSYSLGLGEGWFDGMRIVNGVAIAFGDEAADGNMHFARSTDMGENWTKIEGMDYFDASYSYYTFGTASTVADGVFWSIGFTSSYTGGYIFKTTDSGENWESIEVDPAAYDSTYIRSIAFVDANNGFICARTGSIAKSTDGGANWTALDLPLGAEWVNSIAAVPNSQAVYALDDAGVFYSDDLGENWEELEKPLEAEGDYFISGLFASEDFGYIFTNNGQIFKFEGQGPTAIEPKHKVEVPDQYVLHQNYPNPFNPTTKIAFSIPKSENIKLVVYDMLGQKVATLVNAKLNQGYHVLEWDGRDANGRIASAGVYLYQLQTSNMIKTRKMTFIK